MAEGRRISRSFAGGSCGPTATDAWPACRCTAGICSCTNAMDKMSYLELLKTRGLVGVLGDHADRLAAIPDQEIEAIRRIIVMDLEGILVRSDPH